MIKRRPDKTFLKNTAIILAAALCLEATAFAAPMPVSASTPKTANDGIQFSTATASVDERFESFGSRRIYLIQDAHTNSSAQLNSARVIETLLAERRIKTVFLEAGSGDDSLTRLRESARVADRDGVALSFVCKGLLQGAEYVNLTSDQDLTLWGVEDPGLYARALEAYRVVVSGRTEALAYLDRLDVTIAFLKERTYPVLLNELDGARRAYEGQAITPTAYFAVLNKTARVLGMDPEREPGFTALRRLERKAEAQLPRNVRDQSAQETGSFDAAEIFGPMSDLQRHLYARLARPRAMELARAAFAVEALRRRLLMNYGPDDDLLLRRAAGRVWDMMALTGLVNRRLMDLGGYAGRTVFLQPEVEPVFTAAREFYELTRARDEAFIRNLEVRMSVTGEREAALIAGGYHAPHLKKLLRNRGYSYVSVIPQVTHPTDHTRYEKLLLEQSADPRASVPFAVRSGTGRTAATAMNLRPAAESAARLADLAAALKVTMPVTVNKVAASRMAAPAQPTFTTDAPTVRTDGIDRGVFETRLTWKDESEFRGKVYLRCGVADQRWDFVEARMIRVEGTDQWRATAEITPYFDGKRSYEGTFVWFEPGIRPRKMNPSARDAHAVWQAALPGENTAIELTLTAEESARKTEENRRAISELFVASPNISFRASLPNKTIAALRGTVAELAKAFVEKSEADHALRMRIHQFLRDLFDSQQNYLNLPAAWFTDAAGLEALQPVLNTTDGESFTAVAETLWHRITDDLKNNLQEKLIPHLRSKVGVPHLPAPSRQTTAVGYGRLDVMNGNGRDISVFEGSGQLVVNAALGLIDHSGKKVTDGFNIRVRMPQTEPGEVPKITFAGRYYDIRTRDDSTPSGYREIRSFDHVYNAAFSPFAAEDLQAKYAIGAMDLVMGLLGTHTAEFMRANGRHLVIEIDSFLPERTGLGGSVTLGSLITVALLNYMNVGQKLTHEDIALAGMLLEANLGDLGGWQDGYLGSALRYLSIAPGQPVISLINLLNRDKKYDAVQKDFLDQLQKNGVLFLSHPHRSGHTLKKLISGFLRRDPEFMDSLAAGDRDSADFFKAISTAAQYGGHIDLSRVAGWLNGAREQFEAAAPGFVTADVAEIIKDLTDRGWIMAAKPVGAGAGGFLYLLLSSPEHRPAVEGYLREWTERNTAKMRHDRPRENFLDPGVFPFSLNPADVPGLEIRIRDVLSGGARMAVRPDRPTSRGKGGRFKARYLLVPMTAAPGSSSQPRLKTWLRRPGAAAYLRDVAEQPAAERGMHLALWTGAETLDLTTAILPGGSVRVLMHRPRPDLEPLPAQWDHPGVTLLPKPSPPTPSSLRFNDQLGSELAGRVTEARSGIKILDPAPERGTPRLAVMDLSVFGKLDSRALANLVPMIAAAAERSRRRAGGNAAIQVRGPEALRKIFLAAVEGTAAGNMFLDQEAPLPAGYQNAQAVRIGAPASLKNARRVLPVRPINVTAADAAVPAAELWFDAAFYLSTPDPSAERLYEFFKKRTGRSDFTLSDVRGLLDGRFNLSLLRRLALPPLLRVPVGDLLRAAAAAARMSERSA